MYGSMYFFGWLKQIKQKPSKYFRSICICFTLICPSRPRPQHGNCGSAYLGGECRLFFGIYLRSFRTHEPPPRSHQWGVHRGAAPPTRRRGNPIAVDSPLRMVTAIAPLFSVITNLYRGKWLLIWTLLENQSIRAGFVCLVISFWTMLFFLRLPPLSVLLLVRISIKYPASRPLLFLCG